MFNTDAHTTDPETRNRDSEISRKYFAINNKYVGLDAQKRNVIEGLKLLQSELDETMDQKSTYGVQITRERLQADIKEYNDMTNNIDKKLKELMPELMTALAAYEDTDMYRQIIKETNTRAALLKARQEALEKAKREKEKQKLDEEIQYEEIQYEGGSGGSKSRRIRRRKHNRKTHHKRGSKNHKRKHNSRSRKHNKYTRR